MTSRVGTAAVSAARFGQVALVLGHDEPPRADDVQHAPRVIVAYAFRPGGRTAAPHTVSKPLSATARSHGCETRPRLTAGLEGIRRGHLAFGSSQVSRCRSCSSSRSSRRTGIFEARSVCSVSSAHARKQAAPSDVFQLAAARSSIEPVDGTT